MKIIIIFFAFLIFNLCEAAQKPTLRVEVAGATTGYNFFRIPNENANTRFDLPTNAWLPIYRIYASIPVSEKWGLRFLYAPLTVNYSYQSPVVSVFNNTSFAANTPLTAGYKFNSYRVSIIRHVEESADFKWHWGFTAKIRDAYITVSDGATTLRKDDLGFVPLLNLGLDWSFLNSFILSFDIDGLAGGPGRAFDGRLDVQYKVIEKTKVGLGYRFVEGGAVITAVNNFALFHALLLSAEYEI
ncbi:MAG: hypothetical protein KA715_10595 [Xanthomonadaceae bacterium]|nr:hypothetical protein [Xanthomonadaceae bacterium]